MISKKILLITLGAFFILGAAVLWYWNSNTFSTAKVELEILAPEERVMGEEVTYAVRYKNNASVRLENVSLVFEYPAGTVPVDQEQSRVTTQIDRLNPQEERTLQFRGHLFGREGDIKEARAYITYTPRNLTGSFRSETTAVTRISSVPVTFEFDLPSRTENGQRLEFVLNYFSNSDYPLSDLRVRMEYPDGFTFESASPSPIGDEEWDIGVLNKARGGRITLQGRLEGELREAKQFRAVLGTVKEGEFTPLKEVSRATEIQDPQINITQTINGVENYTASPGDSLHYEIFFRNVNDRDLQNLFLIVTLEGRAFDMNSVRTEDGKFQEGDNTIVWDEKNTPKLRFLGRGEEGKVEFWVDVRDDWNIASRYENNFVVRDKVLLSESKEVFETKINSRLTLEQKGYYENEVFDNRGPIPPEVGEETTYAIQWSVENFSNVVDGAKVTAILPPEVKMTGNVFPNGQEEDSPEEDEDEEDGEEEDEPAQSELSSGLTYDSQSREVVWNIGQIDTGVGNLSPAKSVWFQVELTPDRFQRGDAATLIGEAILTGRDTFTGQELKDIDSTIDTTLPDDSTVSGSEGRVE